MNTRPTPIAPAPGVGRIPVTLLTGFLGAGKTTLLNHLMRQPGMQGTAVLINEFGEVGIDHHLVDKVDETLMILDSGCLCCSVQGDLVKALKQLSLRSSRREIPPVTRVIIETTGLADPVPVVYTLMEERFVAARYLCDGVVTAVDATHGAAQLTRHREAVRQVAMADLLLITKADLADSAARATLETRIAQLNPSAPQIEVHNGKLDADRLSGLGVYSANDKLPDVAEWLGEEKLRQQAQDAPAPMAWRTGGRQVVRHAPVHHARRHDAGVTSFVVSFPEAVPWNGFAVAMGRILQNFGPRILRVKGLMNVAGENRPVAVHCVQNVAYPPVRLNAWPLQSPFEDHCGRLVFIMRDLAPGEEDLIRDLLARPPASAAALRAALATPLLPTRCWLSQPMAQAPGQFEIAGWNITPKRL